MSTGLSPGKRFRVFARDDWKCFYCGNPVRLMGDEVLGVSRIPHEVLVAWATVDHVVPIKKNGTDDPENLVTACRRCNTLKRDMTLEEFREYNRRKVKNYGKAKDALVTALEATSTPFDDAIISAVEWIENQMPVVVFAGEKCIAEAAA